MDSKKPSETGAFGDERALSSKKAAGRSPDGAAIPVVGIGASAGGLEAFVELLGALPVDTGMAFVLVQHLARSHESALPELLARVTRMPVHQAQDGMKIEPDTVYVIPPNVDIAVFHGVLRLVGRDEAQGRYMPVDYFLRSLAIDQGGQAVGVVLSGTGSDGALGLRAIKAEEGITFAQDPETAKYDGMPRSAVATGAVDFVLPLKGISRELARIAKHPYIKRRKAAEASIEAPEGKETLLAKLFVALRDATGVDFAEYKAATVERRIARRMVVHKTEKLEEYVAYLLQNPNELGELYRDLLINATGFFREPELFDALKREVFPRITRDRQVRDTIRIWVPGCSTGEEPYSIAIALVEFLDGQPIKPPIMIFASDIDEDALERARSGVYPDTIAASVSPERLERFFDKEEGGYRISKAIREMCIFARHDVTRDPPFSRMDIVSCRNVLIYLRPALQKKLFPLFHYALVVTGFLVLGPSESIGEFEDLFGLVNQKHKIYEKKPAKARIPVGFSTRAPIAVEAGLGARPPQPGFPKKVDVQREADQVLLAAYAPTGILVDDGLQIVQFRGDTTPYLRHPTGRASLNLFNMIHEDLAFDVRSAIKQARKTNAPVVKEAIGALPAKSGKKVVLEVIPITAADGGRYFWVLFKEVIKSAAEVEEKPSCKVPTERARRAEVAEVEELRQELFRTREELRSTIEENETSKEELTASFEELQSSNEELQSINEELETAKEELQSSNEELGTVNEELESRNRELIEIGDDLQNLLTSTTIPIILLGRELSIRRFTPAAGKVLNLISSDVGRPIGDLSLQIEVPDLERLVGGVMESLNSIEKEVQDRKGHWYSLQVRPYRTSRNTIGGAVLSVVDIDAVKRGMLEVEEARSYAQGIVDTIREPLIVLDDDLRVVSANHAFYDAFKVTEEETDNKYIFDLGERQWDIPRLRALLEKILPEKSVLTDFEVDHVFPAIGRKTMLLNARRLLRNGKRPLILLVVRDITESKRNERMLQHAYDVEHHIAQTVQDSLLEPIPVLAGLEIGVAYESSFEAERVGGDIYDVFDLGNGLVTILIGDVSGRGVATAVLASSVRSTVRAFASIDSSPASVLRRTNQLLVEQVSLGVFVTAALVVLDTRTHMMKYANAGHPDPIMYGNGCGQLRVSHGLPLGAFKGDYQEASIKLEKDQSILLYTDGLTEVRRGADFFGEERLLSACASLKGRSPSDAVKDLLNRAVRFVEGKIKDDIAIVAIRLSE